MNPEYIAPYELKCHGPAAGVSLIEAIEEAILLSMVTSGNPIVTFTVSYIEVNVNRHSDATTIARAIKHVQGQLLCNRRVSPSGYITYRY